MFEELREWAKSQRPQTSKEFFNDFLASTKRAGHVYFAQDDAEFERKHARNADGEFTVTFGQRKGLFDLPDMEISRLTGGELGVGKEEIRANAIKKLRSVGAIENKDTGWRLVIGRIDWKKMAAYPKQSLAGLQAIAAIEEIAANAVLAETHEDDDHNNPDVQAIHRMYAPVEIGGALYRVKLTVRHYKWGKGVKQTSLHALEAMEIENAPPGNPLAVSRRASTPDVQAQPTAGRKISIADLLKNSTRNKGREWEY